MFVYSGAYYHYVTGITAHTNGDAALTLTFNGKPSQYHTQHNSAKIVLFMEDKDLVDRLIVAINGAAPAPAPESHEDIEL